MEKSKEPKFWTDEMGKNIYPFQPALSTKSTLYGKPCMGSVKISTKNRNSSKK